MLHAKNLWHEIHLYVLGCLHDECCIIRRLFFDDLDMSHAADNMCHQTYLNTLYLNMILYFIFTRSQMYEEIFF